MAWILTIGRTLGVMPSNRMDIIAVRVKTGMF